MFHIKSFYKRLGHLGRNLPLQPEIAYTEGLALAVL